MDEKQRGYFSGLLRFWEAEQDGVLIWRASLEDAQTGQTLRFDHPQKLFQHLIQEMEGQMNEKKLPFQNRT